MLVTRLASLLDSAPIARLWRIASAEHRTARGIPAAPASETARDAAQQQRVLGCLADPMTFAVVSEDDSEPVAVALAMPARAEGGVAPEPIPGLAHVSMLAVSPDRWGQGLGSAVLESTQTIAGERGFARAQLWAHETNRRAQRLYERLGWRPSRRTGIDEHGEPVRHYIRDL